MNGKGRIKITIGVLLVFAAVGLLTLTLIVSMSRVESQAAELSTDYYTVGSNYAGTITKQYVAVGDKVERGDLLFNINSPTLTDDVINNRVDSTSFSLNGKGELSLVASSDGVVSNILISEGSFVPGNKDVAVITKKNSTYVKAEFRLSPPDYARIGQDSTVLVLLPNNTTVKAKVFDVSVKNKNGIAVTVVKARLTNDASLSSFMSGTPVSATLQLNNVTGFERLGESVKRLLQPQ